MRDLERRKAARRGRNEFREGAEHRDLRVGIVARAFLVVALIEFVAVGCGRVDGGLVVADGTACLSACCAGSKGDGKAELGADWGKGESCGGEEANEEG